MPVTNGDKDARNKTVLTELEALLQPGTPEIKPL